MQYRTDRVSLNQNEASYGLRYVISRLIPSRMKKLRILKCCVLLVTCKYIENLRRLPLSLALEALRHFAKVNLIETRSSTGLVNMRSRRLQMSILEISQQMMPHVQI